MTDINDLVLEQEFWRTSSDSVVRATFFALLRLLEILRKCLKILKLPVCFVIIAAVFDFS